MSGWIGRSAWAHCLAIVWIAIASSAWADGGATPPASGVSQASSDSAAAPFGVGMPPRRYDLAGPPRRYELAGFPIIGGNSDIGLQFGGAATWTRFYDQAAPYLWNIDLLLSASVKDDVDGFRLVEQSHVLRLDAPSLLDGELRLDIRGSFQRQINAGYYGLGNATTADPNPSSRRYQYGKEQTRVRAIARLHTKTPLDIAFGASARYEYPDVYNGSRLDQDFRTPDPQGPNVLGRDPEFVAGAAVGLMFDTRDSEFITRRGVFYQVGIGATAGTTDGIAYGDASAVLAHYAPLGPVFIFASRFVASVQFGRVPFYDLAQGGTFEPQYLLGGESGVRGIPQGRYAGAMKVIANTEIRGTPFPRFSLFGSRFRVGTTTFFDAGRTWANSGVISSVDGNSLGLKYGVGGGLFLQWGEAAIFRVEVAYSPDAVSENPSLPLGIYVSDGLTF